MLTYEDDGVVALRARVFAGRDETAAAIRAHDECEPRRREARFREQPAWPVCACAAQGHHQRIGQPF